MSHRKSLCFLLVKIIENMEEKRVVPWKFDTFDTCLSDFDLILPVFFIFRWKIEDSRSLWRDREWLEWKTQRQTHVMPFWRNYFWRNIETRLIIGIAYRRTRELLKLELIRYCFDLRDRNRQQYIWKKALSNIVKYTVSYSIWWFSRTNTIGCLSMMLIRKNKYNSEWGLFLQNYIFLFEIFKTDIEIARIAFIVVSPVICQQQLRHCLVFVGAPRCLLLGP